MRHKRLIDGSACVLRDDLWTIEGETRVRIDSDENNTTVRVDGTVLTEPHFEVVKHRRLVQVTQMRQIILCEVWVWELVGRKLEGK